MSTATTKKPAAPVATTAATDNDDAKYTIEFTPFGERQSIKLSPNIIRNMLARPTKKGVFPDNQTIFKFMMLCKARELNPFAGDAYLIGYDGTDGAEFSCITAQQALLKRAEASPDYDGMRSGVIVKVKETGEIIDREGDFTHEDDILLGGWAEVYVKGRRFPSTDRLKVTNFDKGMSQWKKDREGMIVKCAESSALRKAFPTQLGGLYASEEYERFGDVSLILDAPRLKSVPPDTLNGLAATRPALTAPTNGNTVPPMQQPHRETVPAQQSRQPEPQQQEQPQEFDGEITLDYVMTLLAEANNYRRIEAIRVQFVGPDSVDGGAFTPAEWNTIQQACVDRSNELASGASQGEMFPKGNPAPE